MGPDLKRWSRAILLGAFLVIALAAGPSLLWVRTVASGVRAEVAKLEAERRRWSDRMAHRPPVRGAGAPGNAWDDYAAACALPTRELLRFGDAGPTPPPPAHVVALADGVRAGAERTRAPSQTTDHARFLR